MRDWKGKKVAVLGLAIEGVSSAVYLHKKGAEVTLLDEKDASELDKTFFERTKTAGIPIKTGTGSFGDLNLFDVIVRSPGIKRSHPEIVVAQNQGREITSQTILFFAECPAPIVGVTGTKGKGTTSSLIYEMLKASGKDAYLGGNIGLPPFTFFDQVTPDSFVVLELSSFQLEDLQQSPHIAVMLMVTQEHLNSWDGQNYHESIEAYIDAKRNIVRFQKKEDFAIFNRDYPASHESDVYTEGQVYEVSREGEVPEGCFVRENVVWVRYHELEDKIIDTKDILLPGRHNFENVCAAVMAATILGVDKKHIVSVLRTFKGLVHRLELIGEFGGVRYYDDSFSTTPETAIAAIEAFTEPEILILGGSDKDSDFTLLGHAIFDAKNIKAIIGIGMEWPKIKAKIHRHSGEVVQATDSRIKERSWTSQDDILFIEGATNMHKIVAAAAKIAEPGDIVLLSPACASFDMFKNYKDRGEQFKHEVQSLTVKA